MDQLLFKMPLTPFARVRGTCQAYFKYVCMMVADISRVTHFRSAERHDMLIPRTRTHLGQQSFHVVWNFLHADDQPALFFDTSQLD